MNKIIYKSDKNQFYTIDGKEYIGEYYLDKNNIAYTNTGYPKKLIPVNIYNTELYRKKANTKGGFTSPHPHIPKPNSYDYSIGYIERYFVQKRTNPAATIVEISQEQYNSTTYNDNFSFINSNIYSEINIKWAISGVLSYVTNFNKREIEKVSSRFIGIENYLNDLSQFYKESWIL